MFWLITGLGNPGFRYKYTRHNIGFRAIDHISEAKAIPLSKKGHNALWGLGQIDQSNIIILKPLTYMNKSGISVKSIMSAHNILPDHLIVIHDDLDLMPGRLRIREDGGSGGHKGVRSIVDLLNSAGFIRIRIGIGKPEPGMEPADYVLSRCSTEELEKEKPIIMMIDEVVGIILKKGIHAAMNLYNNRSFEDEITRQKMFQ